MKTKTVVFLVVALVIFVGLFLLAKQKEEKVNEQSGITLPIAQEKVFELKVVDRKLVSGPSILKVNKGDNVVIRISVDEDEELHLHGYDKSVDLEKNIPGVLSFTANLTGRFEFELEDSKTDLGALEVMPK